MAYKQDIELLNQGILPDSLNFNLTTTNEVDIERLQYNVFLIVNTNFGRVNFQMDIKVFQDLKR